MKKLFEHLKAFAPITKCLLAIGGLYLFFNIIGIGCPILFLTGVSCAGCGMTRAFSSVFRLDFASAFAFHPLWVLIPILAGVFLAGKRISSRVKTAIYWTAVVAFTAVYIIRLLGGTTEVIQVDIKAGAIWQGFTYIKNILMRGGLL